MKSKRHQYELPVAGQVFNLATQTGIDPWREERDGWANAERMREAREYQARMQRTLEECPGFIGAEAPSGPETEGKLVVEPAKVFDARAWLKRRFYITESFELEDSAQGLVFKVAPRVRKALASPGARVRVRFAPAEQFELALG